MVTYYDTRGVAGRRGDLSRSPCASARTARRVTLGAYANVTALGGPVLVERNQLTRAAHVLMQTEGRDIGSAAAELEARLAQDPRTREAARWTSSARSS